jgi:hypothetical protein
MAYSGRLRSLTVISLPLNNAVVSLLSPFRSSAAIFLLGVISVIGRIGALDENSDHGSTEDSNEDNLFSLMHLLLLLCYSINGGD